MQYEATPSPALLEWVRANGLEPNDIPLHSSITVANDRITVEEYVRDDLGYIEVENDEPKRRMRVVPVVVRSIRWDG